MCVQNIVANFVVLCQIVKILPIFLFLKNFRQTKVFPGEAMKCPLCNFFLLIEYDIEYFRKSAISHSECILESKRRRKFHGNGRGTRTLLPSVEWDLTTFVMFHYGHNSRPISHVWVSLDSSWKTLSYHTLSKFVRRFGAKFYMTTAKRAKQIVLCTFSALQYHMMYSLLYRLLYINWRLEVELQNGISLKTI